MTQEESETLFFMFLDYWGALESWNRQRFSGLCFEKKYFLTGSLFFIATKEGHDYWMKIHHEWLGVIDKIDLMVKLIMAFAQVYTKTKHRAKEIDIDLINDMAREAIKVFEIEVEG